MKGRLADSLFFVSLCVVVCGIFICEPNFAKNEGSSNSPLLLADLPKKPPKETVNSVNYDAERKRIELELRDVLEHKEILENEIGIILENISILESEKNWKEKITENELKILEVEIYENALEVERTGYRERYATGVLTTEEYEELIKKIGFEKKKTMSKIHSLRRQNAILQTHGIKKNKERETAITELKNHLKPIYIELEKTVKIIDELQKRFEEAG